MRQFFTCSAAIVLLLLCSMPVQAGQSLAIIEGADPVGALVGLAVRNHSPEARTGTIFVKVVLADGTAAVGSTAVSVGGDSQQAAQVQFAGAVRSVISVAIIEDPDPIPQ